MTTLKGWIATTFLVVTLVFSTTTANAGIIIAGLNDKTGSEPCKEETTKEKSEGGIIIAGVGIIIAGLTGIIIAGASSDEPVNCGIIIAG